MWEIDKDVLKIGAAAAAGTAVAVGLVKVGGWLWNKATSKDEKKEEKK